MFSAPDWLISKSQANNPGGSMYRVWNYLSQYSLLLVLGALIAIFWANLDHHSYEAFVEFPIWDHNHWIGHAHYENGELTYRTLTLHYLVNDVLMALFFAIAGKEVWEAVALKHGSLRGKKALSPLIATAGGMFGPIAIYFLIASMFGSTTLDALKNGWAVPTATDIAFSYLVGRIIFGAGHPAIRFLLLLAIADDAAGLIILAVAYPQAPLQIGWLLLSAGAAILVWFFFNELPRRRDRGKQDRPNSTRIRKALGGWPYVIAGIISWYGFQQAGIHPALGLLPVIPAIPHADRAFGIFAAAERYLTDLLNVMEHALKIPVEFVLFLFGLCNAGVLFTSIGPATWAVLGGLLIGKPLGIYLFGLLAAKPLKLGLPKGMEMRDVFVVGTIASIGFTVSLFVSVAAFEPGMVQDAAKMGALLSFFGAFMAIIAGRMLRVEKTE